MVKLVLTWGLVHPELNTKILKKIIIKSNGLIVVLYSAVNKIQIPGTLFPPE